MKIKVTGGQLLKGKVTISGAKNASIPLICASLLAKGKVVLKNVPRISDIFDLIEIIKKLHCEVTFKGHTLWIDNTNLTYEALLFPECHKMRGSYYLIGVCLTLFGKCEILMPGGCKIGNRPIDIHLQAFSDLGYDYEIHDDILLFSKRKVYEKKIIKLKKKSVGASINALFAGLSITNLEIRNGLFEPEGQDVIRFLKEIGYQITCQDDTIYYVKTPLVFQVTKHKVIPDRIEAMTYAVLGLLTGNLHIKQVNTLEIEYPLKLLKEAGFTIRYNETSIWVKKSYGKNLNIKTSIYPGFPTDLQSIFGVLFLHTEKSTMIETVFENRMHIYYDLQDSGVDCNIKNNQATVLGKEELKERTYKAYDLRHGAALCILALMQKHPIEINNFEYVLRGYDNMLNKLKKIGARIEIK